MTRLEQIRARVAAATKGPWTLKCAGICPVVIAFTYGRQEIFANPNGNHFPSADAELIAASPADLAYLLDEVARLRAALEEIGRSPRCTSVVREIAREALKENPNA